MRFEFGKNGKVSRSKNVEKVLSGAVTEKAAAQNPEGWQQIVKVEKFREIKSIADPKTGLSTHHAKGSGTIQMLRLKDDALFPKKKCSFVMEAAEGFDDIGLPDIKVKTLKIIE